MRSSIRVGCGGVPSGPTRPRMPGIENPWTSASMSPTRRPRAARLVASSAVSVDLPTPPLPLVTAITRDRESGPNGIDLAGRPARSSSLCKFKLPKLPK